MKRWLTVVVFGTLGRLFNNPQLLYKFEDRLANSPPIRQLARTIVALIQRGSWEMKQFKVFTDKQKALGQEPFSEVQENLSRKFKQYQDELKRRAERK